MPMYVYGCPSCGIEVEERRPISRIDDPVICPICGDGCSRSVTTFAIGSSFKEQAPVSMMTKRAHRAGCPCCVPRAPKKVKET